MVIATADFWTNKTTASEICIAIGLQLTYADINSMWSLLVSKETPISDSVLIGMG